MVAITRSPAATGHAIQQIVRKNRRRRVPGVTDVAALGRRPCYQRTRRRLRQYGRIMASPASVAEQIVWSRPGRDHTFQIYKTFVGERASSVPIGPPRARIVDGFHGLIIVRSLVSQRSYLCYVIFRFGPWFIRRGLSGGVRTTSSTQDTGVLPDSFRCQQWTKRVLGESDRTSRPVSVY